jgi:hypothetical protein
MTNKYSHFMRLLVTHSDDETKLGDEMAFYGKSREKKKYFFKCTSSCLTHY